MALLRLRVPVSGSPEQVRGRRQGGCDYPERAWTGTSCRACTYIKPAQCRARIPAPHPGNGRNSATVHNRILTAPVQSVFRMQQSRGKAHCQPLIAVFSVDETHLIRNGQSAFGAIHSAALSVRIHRLSIGGFDPGSRNQPGSMSQPSQARKIEMTLEVIL